MFKYLNLEYLDLNINFDEAESPRCFSRVFSLNKKNLYICFIKI